MGKQKEVPFLIAGGGIGGLAAALSVAETGREVTVIERAPEFGEVGAGLQLGPNGVAVLDQLGVLDAVYENAVFPKRLVIKDAVNGGELVSLDVGETFRKHYGYPYIVMHRADLHQALLNACKANERITLISNQEVESVEDLTDKAKVNITDGSTYLANIMIGADGVHSKTRKLFVDDQPVDSKYVAYRGTIPMAEMSEHPDPDDVIMWIGPNLHLVQYPVRRKELYNQVIVFKSKYYKPNSDDWGTPEELHEHFNACCKDVRHAVSYYDPSRRWPMADRNPITNWSKNRITLLGDAAHPMLQYLAQGAVQALEDAACLNGLLHTHGDDIETAFKEYEKERAPRAGQVQTNARAWGEVLHAVDPVAIMLRNRIFTEHEPTDYKVVEWLYGRRYNSTVKS